MAPPRAGEFRLSHLGALDGMALREFLSDGEAGVSAHVLGIAAQSADPTLVRRLAAALSPERAAVFAAAHATRADRREVTAATAEVVECLFWPLVYWHDPAAYDALVEGEAIHPGILGALELDGRDVCDIGAGTGRLTLFAAARARRVIAVDIVPGQLDRLAARLRAAAITNVEIRRGGFGALPLVDGEVDCAVSCSAMTSRAPIGGEAALAEMTRVVRPGGRLAVVWPDRPAWFEARGFRHVVETGNQDHAFADAETAERLCRDFYGEAAAAWVKASGRSSVPYEVLGVRPPNDACIRDLPDDVSRDRGAG